MYILAATVDIVFFTTIIVVIVVLAAIYGVSFFVNRAKNDAPTQKENEQALNDNKEVEEPVAPTTEEVKENTEKKENKED